MLFIANVSKKPKPNLKPSYRPIQAFKRTEEQDDLYLNILGIQPICILIKKFDQKNKDQRLNRLIVKVKSSKLSIGFDRK